jgi:hypothetical protein
VKPSDAGEEGTHEMKLSTDRILTTHVGSLPRPPDLLTLLEARETGREFDQPAFETRLATSVHEIVAKQVATGIDSVCDGELSARFPTPPIFVTVFPGSVRSAAATTTSRRRPPLIATFSTIPTTCSGSTRRAASHGSAAKRFRAARVRSLTAIGGRWRQTLRTLPPPVP